MILLLSNFLCAFAAAAVVSLVGTLAWVLDTPALAPPLGVTALLCFQTPHANHVRPRNILLGHCVGLTAGWLALAICGGLTLPGAFAEPFAWRYAAASGFAIFGTAVGMDVLDCPHPPAAATTLVMSLGLLTQWQEVAGFLLGAACVTLLAGLISQASGGAWSQRGGDSP